MPSARAQGWRLSQEHITSLFHTAVGMDLHEQNHLRRGDLRWVTAVLYLGRPLDSVVAANVQRAFWTENSGNMIRTLWGMIRHQRARLLAIQRFFEELKTYIDRHGWPQELFEQTMHYTRGDWIDDFYQKLMDELRLKDFETYTLVQKHWDDSSWRYISFNMDRPADANASTDDGEW